MEKSLAIDLATTDALPVSDNESAAPAIPEYLARHYRWAYLNPKSVRFFERQWIVNLILWGNFARLRNAALAEMGAQISGRTLQIACVYGDFTARLVQRLAPGARLDVVDVAPIQLANLRRKIGTRPNRRLHHQDASALDFDNGTFDNAVLFFLLHELPEPTRRSAIGEALRVLAPGGRLVVVDYHRPRRLHPHRYLMWPALRVLEPFALDLWNKEIPDWIPDTHTDLSVRKSTFFGGVYQKVVITRAPADG